MLREIMIDRDGHPRGYAISEGLLADRWVEHIHREAENLLPLPFAGGFLGPDLLP